MRLHVVPERPVLGIDGWVVEWTGAADVHVAAREGHGAPRDDAVVGAGGAVEELDAGDAAREEQVVLDLQVLEDLGLRRGAVVVGGDGGGVGGEGGLDGGGKGGRVGAMEVGDVEVGGAEGAAGVVGAGGGVEEEECEGLVLSGCVRGLSAPEPVLGMRGRV